MITDILDWRSKISGRAGLAKSARFRVSIMPNQGFLAGQQDFLRNFPFYCADAELAGISLNTSDARIYGPMFKTPNQVAFNDFTLHVLTSEGMFERVFFGEWLNFISGDGTFDFRFRNEYATTVVLEKFTEKATGTPVPIPTPRPENVPIPTPRPDRYAGNVPIPTPRPDNVPIPTPRPEISEGVDVTMTMEFRNAYPVQVLAVPVSWGDEAFLRTQVQFSYTHHIQK